MVGLYPDATAERFNLSSAVETMALPFESQAFEQQKKFEIDIQPELYFQGNPEQIRRMIGILIDNAFKYSAEHGAIRVSLKEEAGGRSVLEVYNTGKGVREDEKEKIFEIIHSMVSGTEKAAGKREESKSCKIISDKQKPPFPEKANPETAVLYL